MVWYWYPKQPWSPPLTQNLILNEDGVFEDTDLGKVKKIVWFDDPVVSEIFIIDSENSETENN